MLRRPVKNRGTPDYLEDFKFDEYFMICKIKDKTKKRKLDNIYFRFFTVFSAVKSIIIKLNGLYNQGYEMGKDMPRQLPLSDDRGISHQLQTLNETSSKWGEYLTEIFDNSDQLENFYILHLFGRSLVKFKKQNMRHFLKYLSSQINFSKLKTKWRMADIKSSRDKITFFQDLIKKNKYMFSANDKYFIRQTNNLDSSVNVAKVPSSEMYLHLLFMYKQLKVRLEPNLFFNCTIKTTWRELESKAWK